MSGFGSVLHLDSCRLPSSLLTWDKGAPVRRNSTRNAWPVRAASLPAECITLANIGRCGNRLSVVTITYTSLL